MVVSNVPKPSAINVEIFSVYPINMGINAINRPGIISPSIHCLTIVSEHFTISGCAFPS